MKKFLTLLCMITCIFGLTACGSEDKLAEYEKYKLSLTKYEKEKIEGAEKAAEQIIPILVKYADSELNLDDYTMEEIEYNVEVTDGINVDGYAFYSAVGSFRSNAESVGKIKEESIGIVTCEIDGKQIIVEVEISGENKDAIAEVILSNDKFLKLESAALNPSSTMGELMTGAALNTLIGMLTVFAVLILISGIISCFRIIPKMQNAAAERKAKKTGSGDMKVVVQKEIAAKPIEQAAVDQSDDLELAAVIAAAIAACEGAASTDGFVVRSIRRYR